MLRGYLNKQRQLMIWCGVLVFVLFMIPAGAWAATILAEINVAGAKIECESPFTTIAGEDVSGRALILGLDLSYERQIEDGVSRSGSVVNNPIGIVKNLDPCTPLLLQALMQQQRVDMILTIFDTHPDTGVDRVKTRITLEEARIVAVKATGDGASTEPQVLTTQELVKVLAQQVSVEDLVAGTSFQFNFATNR